MNARASHEHGTANSRLVSVSKRLVLVLAPVLVMGLIVIGYESRTKRYTLHGQVLNTNAANNEITVKHDDIPGFMPAMTMPYKVKDPVFVKSLKPGDMIVAELVTTSKGSDYWLEDIRVTDERQGRSVPIAAPPHFLSPGERVPDLVLTNQDGKAFRLDDFEGRAVLVTFIYTRCPMPNFCPRLSSQFARIHEDLAKTPDDYQRTHLLTVSFDPKYDTAPVLRKYGLAYLDNDPSGFSHWDFASTTADDLRNLAQAFGLEYFEEDNQITHTMNIALIKPDGTIAKYWSTDWTADELEDALRQAAHSASASLPEASERRYRLDGVVLSINPKLAELTVRHKDIPGYMAAMTMPYRVQKPQVLGALARGDRIQADVVVQGDSAHLENVTVTGHVAEKGSQ